MPSKRDITFYKSIILVQIHSKMIQDGAVVSIGEVDDWLKYMYGYEGSTKDMTHEQFQEFKENCKFIGAQLGVIILDQEEL